jgi:hypothetical protein
MSDVRERAERLRDDAAECAIIASGLANTQQRDLFVRLARQLSMLAEVGSPETFLGRKTYEPFPSETELATVVLPD